MKFCRDYKKFDNVLFKVDIENDFRNLTDLTYTSLEEIFLKTLGYCVSIKNKILQTNENTFMSKAFRKAIIMRSRIKHLYLKNKTDRNWSTIKNKGIFVQISSIRLKRSFFQNST